MFNRQKSRVFCGIPGICWRVIKYVRNVTYDSIRERDELSDEAYDRYLGAELQLDRGGEVLSGTVKRRKRDIDGTLTGTANTKPSALYCTAQHFFPTIKL